MIFKPKSWGKRPAERRCRLIQKFLIFLREKTVCVGDFGALTHT